MSISTETREIKCEVKDNYKFKNVSLFTSLKVVKNEKERLKKICLCINNVDILPTSETAYHYVFDVKILREYNRDVFGFTEEEHELIRLETTFVYNSLKAISHYKNASTDLLSNSIFSDELEIYFKVACSTIPAFITVEEEYVISDIHKETYN